MADVKGRIDFEHLGIGTVLERNRLTVPPNQRDYKWEDKHVLALFQDFSDAIANQKTSYFLGTIVLTGGDNGMPEVADGQQRLATTTILLAAIRDYFVSRDDTDMAQSIENEFLRRFVRETRENTPHLKMNFNDNEFFKKRILSRPDSPDRNIQPTKESHRNIEKAALLAAEHIQAVTSTHHESRHAETLIKWTHFIRDAAQVIVLKVPDDLNAFVMFETLNDRGLRTSQFDLLKNYLFKEAGDRIGEAQQKWSSMTSVLETIGIDDIGLTYLRHISISKYGTTREKDVYEKLREKVSGRGPAIEFLDKLADTASDYVAILNPENNKWVNYPGEIKRSIATMLILKVVPIRPLMLAVIRNFSKQEATLAFKAFVCWSVRFLIAGGNRSGALDEAYSQCALDVSEKRITKAKELETKLRGDIPTDTRFESEFSVARVTQNNLARYYLRSLELKIEDDPEPQLVPNEETVINLEHVLPQNPGSNWPDIDPEAAASNFRRIGNLVLLQSKVNSSLGNSGFVTKKPAFEKSLFVTTKDVGTYATWGIGEIEDRQKKLAKKAVETWPIAIR